jgi:hypothetical protein
MTSRKGEITRSDLEREWPYQGIRKSAHDCAVLEVTHLLCSQRDMSVAPLTYTQRRDDTDYVVFRFAKPEDADTFCERFGGERLATGSWR